MRKDFREMQRSARGAGKFPFSITHLVWAIPVASGQFWDLSLGDTFLKAILDQRSPLRSPFSELARNPPSSNLQHPAPALPGIEKARARVAS